MVEMIDKKTCVDALKAIKHGLWEIDIPSPGNCPEYKEHHKQIQEMIGVVNNWISILNTIPSYVLSDDKTECLEKEQEPKTVLHRDDGDYCPWCSTITTRIMGIQKLHLGTRCCPYCGQAVKWE